MNFSLRQLKTFSANTKYIKSYKNVITTMQQYVKSQNYTIRIKRTKFYKKFITEKSSYLYVICNKKKDYCFKNSKMCS